MNGGRRQKLTCPLGPLDDGDSIGFEIFIKPEVVSLFEAAKAVEIDVMKRNRSLIFADEGVRRAANGFGYASGLCQTLREAGFARAEVSVQGNDCGFFQTLEKFRRDFPSIGRAVGYPFFHR